MTMTIGSLYFLVSNGINLCSLSCQLSVKPTIRLTFLSFLGSFCAAAVGMHGVAFGGACLVDDALKQAADGSVCERSLIVAFGIFEDLLFAVRLVQRKMVLLFQFADFQRAGGTLIEKLDELTVEFVDAAAEIGETAHAFDSRTNRKEIPRRHPGKKRGDAVWDEQTWLA